MKHSVSKFSDRTERAKFCLNLIEIDHSSWWLCLSEALRSRMPKLRAGAIRKMSRVVERFDSLYPDKRGVYLDFDWKVLRGVVYSVSDERFLNVEVGSDDGDEVIDE